MSISAQNVLKRKVTKLTHGTVDSEVTIRLSNGEKIVSIITKKSAKDLLLSKGKEAYAVIKASNVVIATD